MAKKTLNPKQAQAKGFRFVRVDGTTKISDRQTTVDSFQKEGSGVDIMISSLKDARGGVGTLNPKP